MALLVCDPMEAARLIAERQALGQDRHDEVWDGVYVMAPLANDEHQDLVGGITAFLYVAVANKGLGLVRPGVNVTDRETDWTKNYRVPDVAVFLEGTSAQNRDSHWLGGPDWAVEIVSKGDRAREKLNFYASIGTRELLLIERDPWSLELYRLQDAELVLIGRSTLDSLDILASAVVPLSLRLVSGTDRPKIELAARDGGLHWVV